MAGYYGFGNTGDEAILSTLLSNLRKQRSELSFIVASQDPTATANLHNVRAIRWNDIPSLLEAAQESDLLLLGGGGIFHDYWGAPEPFHLTGRHKDISYYSGIALLAALLEKPLAIHAVGVGPLFTHEGKRWTRLAFELADFATVRDVESKNILKSIGIPANKVRVTTDPAFLLEPDLNSALKIFDAEGISTKEPPLLGVSIRSWEDRSSKTNWKQELAYALDCFLERHHAIVVFVPFQSEERRREDDREAAYDVCSLMSRRKQTRLISKSQAPGVMAGLIAHCRAVIGMRLHSLVFAAITGVPVVGLAYDPKVSNFMQSVGLSTYQFNIRTLDSSQLINAIEQVWLQSKISHEANKRARILQKRARRDMERLAQFLDEDANHISKQIDPLLLREFSLRQTVLLAEAERRVSSTWVNYFKRFMNSKPWQLGERICRIRSILRGLR